MSATRSHPALPLDAWWATDQAAWMATIDAGDGIEPPGLAATWASRSCENAKLAHGRYSGFLYRNGRLRPVARVGERLVAEDLCAFGRELAAQLAPITVLGIFASLNMAIKAMDPTADRTVLKTIIARLERTAKGTRDIAGNLVSPRTLIAIATAMMDRAEQMPGRSLAARQSVSRRSVDHVHDTVSAAARCRVGDAGRRAFADRGRQHANQVAAGPGTKATGRGRASDI